MWDAVLMTSAMITPVTEATNTAGSFVRMEAGRRSANLQRLLLLLPRLLLLLPHLLHARIHGAEEDAEEMAVAGVDRMGARISAKELNFNPFRGRGAAIEKALLSCDM